MSTREQTDIKCHPAFMKQEADNNIVLSAISELSRQMTSSSEQLHQKLDSMEERFVSLEKRMADLESSRENQAESHKRKRRCHNTKLAEAVRRSHNAATNNVRYAPEQGLGSAHNQAVTSSLVQVLRTIPDFQRMDSDQLISSCKTYFETVRRNYRYNSPDLAEKAASAKNSARSRQRRNRLLAARYTVLKPEEMDLWNGVTGDLMSDEEDGTRDGVSGWIVRRPAFRSQELSDLCRVLQSRLDTCPKYTATHHRRLCDGAASDRLPPTTYDSDAAKKHFNQDSMHQVLNKHM